MDAIIINPEDNVAVALRALAAGEAIRIGEDEITARSPVPAGHKIARRAIPAGGNIVKYGMPVGRATADIGRGEHVHVHNVVSGYLKNEQEHHE